MDPLYINTKKVSYRSDTVVFNRIAYLSGVKSGGSGDSITVQTKAVLQEIDKRLAEVGTDKSRLLSATIWMVDVVRDVAELNTVWSGWLVPGRCPARSCVQSKLQGGAMLEISVTAAIAE